MVEPTKQYQSGGYNTSKQNHNNTTVSDSVQIYSNQIYSDQKSITNQSDSIDFDHYLEQQLGGNDLDDLDDLDDLSDEELVSITNNEEELVYENLTLDETFSEHMGGARKKRQGKRRGVVRSKKLRRKATKRSQKKRARNLKKNGKGRV